MLKKIFIFILINLVFWIFNSNAIFVNPKIEKVYNFLSKSIAEYQKENTDKTAKGKEKIKEIHQRIEEIHYQESISRNQELAELTRIEEELNNIIIQ